VNTRYNKKILSIIIPAYNSGKWIVKTLESVDYKYQDNFEILVVDDGSTIA
jgi:glycosyltransferase involved in cell wall biosynthesis